MPTTDGRKEAEMALFLVEPSGLEETTDFKEDLQFIKLSSLD